MKRIKALLFMILFGLLLAIVVCYSLERSKNKRKYSPLFMNIKYEKYFYF